MKLDKNGYAPSIMQSNGCYLCGYRGDLARHEVFHGSNREKSKAYGLWVTLCPRCHDKVHKTDTAATDWRLKREGQVKAMLEYGWTRDEFRERFGRNYV